MAGGGVVAFAVLEVGLGGGEALRVLLVRQQERAAVRAPFIGC